MIKNILSTIWEVVSGVVLLTVVAIVLIVGLLFIAGAFASFVVN